SPGSRGAVGARRSRRLLSLRDTARAMSQENVELGYQTMDAFNRRDLDAFLALMDHDVETVPRTTALEGENYRGHDGVRRWWNQLLAVFPDFRIEVVDEVRDLGDLT